MKYCKSCGNQLTDNAVFCPKCGTRVGNNNNVSPTVENNKPNQEEGLSTWVKIALGVAGIVAFTGICGGFADGMWIAALVSLCALGAVCAVFMGAIEKKYAWTTAIASLLIVLVTIGASAPDENEKTSSQAQTEKQQESQTEKKESNPYAKFAGKYVLYDDEGGKGQRFIVAPDGRFLQDNSFNESDFKVSGGIIPKNDKQFEVSLSEKIFGIKEVWSYKNNQTYAKAWDISYNNTLLFDLNENRMYIDIKQYNNRDYTKPEYYKFRFTKQ